jgi:hypothetical protein
VGLEASKSVLGSRVSGEAPCVAFTPAGDGSVECVVVVHLAEDPPVLLFAL